MSPPPPLETAPTHVEGVNHDFMVPSNAPYVWYTIKDLLRQLERKGLGIIDRPPNTYWQKKIINFFTNFLLFYFYIN